MKPRIVLLVTGLQPGATLRARWSGAPENWAAVAAQPYAAPFEDLHRGHE